ncbi:MAG TPA: HD domain-containing phosphohydrolase [Armatimonadota bacterium]|nr:HD domain-containing phosphohydrolase [Armatimonadota bacterium]
MLGKRAQEENPQPVSQSKEIESESNALARMLNLRSASVGAPDGHSERVAVYSVAIGKHLDLPDKILKDLRSAAILHDVGKVGITREIVEKLGRLTEREFEIMRLHSSIAIRMLERVEGLKDSLPMIKHHHERFDGKGYPDGLVGHDIPLGARIIAVAETFDMLVSDLPWRDARPISEALKELSKCCESQFDPLIVEAFLAIVEANLVELPEELHEQLRQPNCQPTN